MLTQTDIQTLSNLDNKLYYIIMDNLSDSGLEVAREEYKKFMDYLTTEGYNRWVINHLVNSNKNIIDLLN